MSDEHESPAERQARNNSKYDEISNRLSAGGSLKLINEDMLTAESRERIAAVTLNKILFNFGSLIENIAYQAADNSLENAQYEEALPEAELLAEFLAQLVEANEDMNILSDAAKEKLYSKREDTIRAWVGDFEHNGERVDFTIMARPHTKENFAEGRPGVLEESRQARIAITLHTRKHKIDIRVDPDIGNLCIDVDTPVIPNLEFKDIGQAKGHHFNTGMRVPTEQFADTINIFSAVMDHRAN